MKCAVIRETKTSKEEIINAVEAVEEIMEYIEMVGYFLMTAALADDEEAIRAGVAKIKAFDKLVDR